MHLKASNGSSRQGNLLQPHIPFTLGSRELLLQSFFIFSFQDAEAQELGGPVHREEAQLCSAAHEAVRVVPVIYHSQLRLLGMHHLLGNPDLALRQIKTTQKQLLGPSGKGRVLTSYQHDAS